MAPLYLVRRVASLARPTWLLVLLVGLWFAYPLVPSGAGQEVGRGAIGSVCLLTVLWAAPWGHDRGVRITWALVVIGLAGWILGDGAQSVERYVDRDSFGAAPSDVVYLVSYLVLGIGLSRLGRTETRTVRLPPLLDSAITTVGLGTVFATFLIAPILTAPDLTPVARVVRSAYPAADVILLGLLVSLWTASGVRSPAYRLLLAALAALLVGDVTLAILTTRSGEVPKPAWLDMIFLLGYLAVTAAACSPSAMQLGHLQDSDELPSSAGRRMLTLGCGLVLPGLTLLGDAILRGQIPWRIVSVGSIILSVLILARMRLLLRTVEAQAARLSVLAYYDPLTGAANRGTWDRELGHAIQRAHREDARLCIAIIDLDHFKRYNDSRGHQAGDRLLCMAVAAWSTSLRPGELLARYGGEEFGLILPGLDASEAQRRLWTMQVATPDGQSFSAGVAVVRPGVGPEAAVALADRALYDAKQAGRRCARIADDESSSAAVTSR